MTDKRKIELLVLCLTGYIRQVKGVNFYKICRFTPLIERITVNNKINV